MLKSLKSFETLNLSKPSKKAWLSPNATTHIDCNEILDALLESISNEEEDLGTEIYDQLSANRTTCIEIMKESLDAELVYDYINSPFGRGILAGIILTLLGQVMLRKEIDVLEENEDIENGT